MTYMAKYTYRYRLAFITILILSITFLHYFTHKSLIYSHVVYRDLYFLPIILAGFWFGRLGGLLASMSIAFLYLPFILTNVETLSNHDLGNILQIGLFIFIGFLVGWLRDKERKHQHEKRKAENLASLGQAASCIAHDMKTPLAVIGGFTRQIKRKVKHDDKVVEKLDMIFLLVERLELLVKDMLAFAKPLTLQCTYGSIQQLLQETVTIASEKACQCGVEIKSNCSLQKDTSFFDPHRLQQAILNIIVNAIEASPKGGEVSVSVEEGNNEIMIVVEDQGNGISSEEWEKLLSPFVTTKKEGTGLGLPIVKKILDAHNGSLELINRQVAGTVLQMRFPQKPL
jgi:two-component system sensor histidine kinase HydH